MNNIIPQDYSVTREKRSKLKAHQPLVVWFIGLSGSGKSTVANLVEKELFREKIHTYTLDGDNIRGGLNSNLGFSEEDRTENIRRIAEVAALFYDSGTVVLSAFITPFEKDREIIKNVIGKENYIEVFIDTPLEECEKRDVKGLYKKARAGEIKNFTGINSPFEVPSNPDLTINTTKKDPESSAKEVLSLILNKIRN